MKHFLHSLKFKITVINSIVMCVLICLVSIIWQKTYCNDIYRSTEKYASYIVESANEQIEKSLEIIEYNIVSLLYDTQFMNIMKRQNEELTDMKQWNDKKYVLGRLSPYMTLNEHINHITVVTRNGRFYSPTSAYTRRKERFLKYFEQFSGKEDTFLIANDVFPTKYVNEEITNLSMIRPICYVGETIGLIVVDLDLKGLMEEYSALDNFDTMLALYDIRTNQEVYIHNMEKAALQNAMKSYLIEEQKTEDYVIETIGGEKLFLKSFDIKNYGWRIMAAISQKSLVTGYSNAFEMNAVLISSSVLLIFLMVYQLVRLSMRNIDKLTRAMENIQGECLNLHLDITSTDETGLLYQGFKKMLQRIVVQMELIRKKEKEKQKLQFQALQSQINPHFLYNSLNTIKVLATMQGANNVEEVTDALSGLMQTAMSSKQYVTLEQECIFLKNYICMQEYKYGKEIPFEIHMEDGVENFYMLKLLLQPIIENTIKHGELQECYDGKIVFLAYILKGSLFLKIQDNGKGAPREIVDKLNTKCNEKEEKNINIVEGMGIGLENIKQRLYLTYGEDADIRFESSEGKGFSVSMMFPLQMEEPE